VKASEHPSEDLARRAGVDDLVYNPFDTIIKFPYSDCA
jgi:hypothetical protein